MDWQELVIANILTLSIGTGLLLAGILGYLVYRTYKAHMRDIFPTDTKKGELE